MSKESSSARFKFFSGSIGSVFDRSRRKQGGGEGEDAESKKADKTAYAHRREQIRRAQRKHRERKELYIKSLEDRILNLRDNIELRQEYQEASIENSILKEILLAHNIKIPSPSASSSSSQQQNTGIMQVSLVGTVNAPQMLHAHISPYSLDSSEEHKSGQPASVSPPDTYGISFSEPIVSPSTTTTTTTINSSSKPHPQGLDNAQTGIDFVLQLEKPCLKHTMHPIQAGESHGHALTLQASLLSHAPHFGEEKSWAVPAVEFERLFQLSTRLDLDGEITPVQAWNRIKSHYRFQNLTPTGLETLRDAIATKISCFGFGAVIEEFELSDIIDTYLGK